MLDYQKGELNGKKITRFEVAFRTFNGIHLTLESAVDSCVSADIDPRLMIRPVVMVSNTAGDIEEIM